jgi:hypothetical protein
MDLSSSRPGDEQGSPEVSSQEACYGNRCGTLVGLEAGVLGPGCPRPGPFCLAEQASRDTSSFHLVLQIEPPSHHLSREEVRIRVGLQRGEPAAALHSPGGPSALTEADCSSLVGGTLVSATSNAHMAPYLCSGHEALVQGNGRRVEGFPR